MAFPTGWTLLATITSDNTKVSGSSNLTNFPALITEDNIPAGIWSQTDNGGGDVRFSSDESGSTQLACEVVSWDTSGQTCEVWVKVPTLSYNSDTTIYLWGNNTGQTQPARTDTYGSDNVWGSNYKGVWHLQSSLADSSPNAYNLTNSGASPGATGKIGSAYDFERTESDYATISDANGPGLEITGSQTFRCWLKPESIVAFLSIMAKSTAATAHHDLYSDGSGNVVFRINGLTTNSTVTSSGTMSAGTNYMLTGVYDSAGSKLKIFINSTKTEVTASGTGTDTNGAFYLGRNGDGNYLDGILDEVRVLNIALSDDWIATEYNNQNSPSTFWTGSAVATDYTDELADTITLADNISRGVTYNRGTVSAIALVDSLSRDVTYNRGTISAVTLADNVDDTVSYVRKTGSNIVDSLQISLSGSYEIYYTRYASQSFYNSTECTLNSISLKVRNRSIPQGSVFVSVYAHTGTYGTSSTPTGSALATSDSIAITSFTTTPTETTFTFSGANKISLSSDTYYTFVVQTSGTINDLDSGVIVARDDSTGTNGTSHLGNAAYSTNSGSTWSADSARDIIFKVYSDELLSNDTISITDNIDYEYTVGTIVRSLLSSLTITDSLDRQINYIREQLSGLTVTDTINRQQNSIRDLINTLTLADNIDNSVLSLFLISLSSSLSISDNIDQTSSYNQQLLEVVNVAENLVRNIDYNRTLAGSITVTDSLDFVNLLSRELTSAITVSDNLDRVLNINVSLSDGISLDDALDTQNVLNRNIESSLILGDNIDATIVLSRSLTSGLTVADNIDFIFVINRDLSDTLTLTDTIDRVAKYIGKSIASIGEIDTIKPTIQDVEKTKGTTYKIDKDKPILYSIRKG